MGSSPIVVSASGGGGWWWWCKWQRFYGNNSSSKHNSSTSNSLLSTSSNNSGNNESCVLSWSFGYFLFAFLMLGWIASLYGRLMLTPNVRTTLSTLGCQEDGEGSWSIGVFYGDSPFSLKPIEDVSYFFFFLFSLFLSPTFGFSFSFFVFLGFLVLAVCGLLFVS